MRVSVVVDDNMILCDGFGLQFPFALEDSGISAIQWDGESGHVEYKDKTIPNTPLVSFEPYQYLVDAYTGEQTRIATEAAIAETAYLATQTYVDHRGRAYPPIEEQLDFLYHDLRTLFSNLKEIGVETPDGAGTWLATVEQVKIRFPKK
jgi:hypothetical protein